MISWTQGLVAIVGIASCIGGLLWIIFPFWALRKAAPGDISLIKNAYEGFQGKAGPNNRVVSIEWDGSSASGADSYSSGVFRRYRLTLEHYDGTQDVRWVGVSVGPIGGGCVREFGRGDQKSAVPTDRILRK